MFEKDYKNAMENVAPDAETCDKILNTIILKEEVKKHKNPAIPWRIAFACTVCAAIILGVIFIPRNNTNVRVGTDDKNPTQFAGSAQVLTVSKSYDEIYELISKNKYEIKDGALYDEDSIMEDFEMAPGSSAMDGLPPSTSAPTTDNATNSTDAPESDNKDFSGTTEQVEGVAEADIVKTDGEYIYYIKGTKFTILTADGADSKLVSQVELSRKYTADYGDMFLKDDRVIILSPDNFSDNGNFVSIIVYDVSDPASPREVATVRQEGWYNSSRMVGDYMYLISNCHINVSSIEKDDPTTFVPTTEINGVCEAVPADSIYRYDEENYTSSYTVIGAFSYKDGTLSDTASLLGGTDTIYCSQGNIILADTKYGYDRETQEKTYVTEKTVVSKLAINNGDIEYKTSGEVDGTLENQFFIDEHNGYFRFVTTVRTATEKTYKFDNSDNEVVSYTTVTSAALTILDGELKKVGEITNLAKGERVYSVRFMGDTAYFVTFRQTDPLFSADLSDPANPKILGELKIPGFSEYMYPYGDGLLLGFGMDADENTGRTTYLKLSMFDITDPSNVTEQDKTIIDGYMYSPALSNHKSMMVSANKNLIGFATTENYMDIRYMIYEYTGDGFNLKASLEIDTDYKYAMDDMRGLFVGEDFYVVTKNALYVFDMNTFSQLAAINF